MKSRLVALALALALAGGAPPAFSSDEDAPATFLPAVPRIVAIGDLHGDLDATRRALRLAGAIDETDRWIGGDLVVVQTGDQLDRGDDEQEILDLLARLAGEAAAAGGALHALNGNHEIMNARIDLRYVTEGGFEDFGDAVEFDAADAALAEYPEEQRARVAAFRSGGPYARVLADRRVVLVVGDNVFVHAGVRSAHVEYGLERANAEMRAWLLGEGPEPEWVGEKGNLVWTRLYSDVPEEADELPEEACGELAEVLERLGVSRMVVGHTVQEVGITSLCGGRVWCIDVGMAAAYGGEVQVLEIAGDAIRVLREEPAAIPAD